MWRAPAPVGRAWRMRGGDSAKVEVMATCLQPIKGYVCMCHALYLDTWRVTGDKFMVKIMSSQKLRKQSKSIEVFVNIRGLVFQWTCHYTCAQVPVPAIWVLVCVVEPGTRDPVGLLLSMVALMWCKCTKPLTRPPVPLSATGYIDNFLNKVWE